MSASGFSLLLDQDNNVIGLWANNRADAVNLVGISAWLKRAGASESLSREAFTGNVKVTPNEQDARGGYFVFVGPARFSAQRDIVYGV